MGVQPKKPTSKGPAEWFTGDRWIDRIVQPDDHSQLNVGDVHVTPDDLDHWHGAAHDHFMTRISITQGATTWGDHVTGDEYGRGV